MKPNSKRVTRSAQKQTFQSKNISQFKFEISDAIQKFYKQKDKKLKDIKGRIIKEKNQILEEVDKETKTKTNLKKRKHSEIDQNQVKDKVKSAFCYASKYRAYQVVVFGKFDPDGDNKFKTTLYLSTYENLDLQQPFLNQAHDKFEQFKNTPKRTPKLKNQAIKSENCKSQTLSLKGDKKERMTKKRRRKVVDEDFSSAGKDSTKKQSTIKHKICLPLKKPRTNTNLEKFSYTKGQVQKKNQKASNSNSLGKKSYQSKENLILNQSDQILSGIQLNNKINFNKQALNQTIISMEIDSGDENSPNAETKSNPQGGGQKPSKEPQKDFPYKTKEIDQKKEKNTEQNEVEPKIKLEWGHLLGQITEKDLICNLPYKNGERVQTIQIFY